MDRVYKSTGSFIMRTPLIPVDIYKKVFCSSLSDDEMEKIILNLSNENCIKEAIAVVSPQLIEAVNRLHKSKESKKKDKAIESLTKYLIRMTTRTTPYALFAGVSVGEFQDTTNIYLEDNKCFIKRARVDMEWLYGVIRKMESDNSVLYELKLHKNSLATLNGNRMSISYISNLGLMKKEQISNNINASVRYTEQLRFLMEQLEQPLTYRELLERIMKKNPHVSEDKIITFINQVLENELILTELRPALSNFHCLDNVISILEKINCTKDVYIKLVEIRELINKYNNLQLGKGTEIYYELMEKMKKLIECDNYIQIDMKLQTKNNVSLNKKIAEDLEGLADIMLMLSNDSYYNLSEYYSEFVEKYGTNREIPLLELLDEDRGLGAPAGYLKPLSKRQLKHNPGFENQFNKYIKNKLIEAINNSQKEVSLSPNEILQHNENKDNLKRKLPPSFDLAIQLDAGSIDDIQDNNYKVFISPILGASRAGKFIGRFTDLFDKEDMDEFFSLINNKEKEILGDDTIIAELTEITQSGRISNICINRNAREYEIAISTNSNKDKHEILLSDLYIGTEKNWFYIKSKILDRKVNVTYNHMLNPQYLSNIGRFLVDVSNSSFTEIFDFFAHNTFSDMIYVPRIRYKNIVLYMQSWKLSVEILNIDSVDLTFHLFKEKLDCWIEMWNVPTFVYLKEFDNRLLLNLNNNLHIRLIYSKLKANLDSILVITEVESNIDNTIVKSERGHYLSEFIVPFTLSKNAEVSFETSQYKTLSNYKKNINSISTYDPFRNILPLREWVYLKLYGSSTRTEELLGLELFEFSESLMNDNLMEKFFFIRYADPNSHIRLRVKSNSEILLPKVSLWLDELYKKELLTEATIGTYNREIERYGGPDLIELAEEVFHKDSLFVLNIIRLKRIGNLTLSDELICIASIINIMEEIGISYETQVGIFMDILDKDSSRDLFKKDRITYMKISNSNDNWAGLRSLDGGQVLHELFAIRKNSLNEFGKRMEQLDKENKLYNSKLNIVLSIIHMFCNRYMGNREFEDKVMQLTRHSLQALQYFKKMGISNYGK